MHTQYKALELKNQFGVLPWTPSGLAIMPKIEKGEPSKAKAHPRARPASKSTDPEERKDQLREKLARLNREAEMLGEAMSQKPKKA